MKKDVLEYIICPNCGGEFLLKEFTTNEQGIDEGLLTCTGCNSIFPIIHGIPRLLSPELQPKLISRYRSFLDKYNLKSTVNDGFIVNPTDERIAKGFEFEWRKHSRILPEHEKEYLHVLGDVLPPSSLAGKVVLDAGCGQGRFSYFSRKYGARTVIAFDLGEQVLIASENLKDEEAVHVIQASIYNPPFKPVFDVIHSIGVIHHLPDPEKGFRTLYNLLKKDGRIFIWVYGESSIIPVIRLMRKFTLRRSVTFNRVLGFFLAIPLYTINQLYTIVKRIPFCGKIAGVIPFHMYHDRGFSNVWTISFDKINSGIAHYYRHEDLQGWLDRLDDKKSGVLSERYPGKSGSSWRLLAEK